MTGVLPPEGVGFRFTLGRADAPEARTTRGLAGRSEAAGSPGRGRPASDEARAL
jgi:hypothetical protein